MRGRIDNVNAYAVVVVHDIEGNGFIYLLGEFYHDGTRNERNPR